MLFFNELYGSVHNDEYNKMKDAQRQDQLEDLGIIFLTNLEIGYSTPPVGMNLFISSFRFKQPMMRVYAASVPFLIMLLVALLLVTYLPDISLLLVRLFG